VAPERDPPVSVATEVQLSGGTANRGLVTRVGDTVRRPANGATAGVHALLHHLRSTGFTGAPLPLGVDERGREILTYVDGAVPIQPYPGWALTDDALVSVARLLRGYHDAVESFDPTPYRWVAEIPSGFGPRLVGHNDPNLDNVVFRRGSAAALIDFDLAAPGSRVWDVAVAARLWAPLRAEQDITDARAGQAFRRFRLLVDAYGLSHADRGLVAEAIIPSHDWIYGLIDRGARTGQPGFGQYWTATAVARARRGRRWCLRHGPAMRRAMR
jgi:hypothetical protein